MKLFRKILFWCHLTSGITIAGFVVIMSATGVLLTYQKQITAWADRRSVSLDPGSKGRLPVDTLLARAELSAGAKATSVLLRSKPTAAAEVSFGRERRELVDPYTGRVLGEGSAGTREFFRTVTALHRTFGATGENRAVGRALTGAANFAFLFLVISGFYLWWPRNLTWKSVRNVLTFRRGLRGKARDFNWHHVVGFWSLVPLFLITLSGVVISYRWASDLVYRAVGEKPAVAARAANGAPAPAPDRRSATEPAALELLFVLASRQVPEWKSLSMTIPGGAEKSVTISIDAGSGGQPQLRSSLVADRASGEVVRWDRFGDQSAGRRLRSILRFAHTGEILGIPGQTIAGLVSLGSVILAWTGIALVLRRLRGWITRRRRPIADYSSECPAPTAPPPLSDPFQA